MKTEVCIPITATALEKAIEDLRRSEKLADLIELRIDFIRDIDEKKLKKLLNIKKKRAIVACRPKALGGYFNGSEEERIGMLKKAIDLESDFVDIEIESDKGEIKDIINNKKGAKIIVSHHNLEETPPLDDLNSKYNEINELNPDLAKIVTNAASINDNFRIFGLLEGKNGLIAFCMGIRGQISRILAGKYGSRITFAALEEGKESASGQVSINELKNAYNFDSIGRDTKVLGVIGDLAENSMSKYMHNAGFKEKKMDFVYVPFKAREWELEEFINNFRKYKFRGSSVTIPHKEKIMEFLDGINDTARQIGAVNTIINNDGKLIGCNTDCLGALGALKEKTGLKDKKILVVGAGGGARAIIYGLKKECAEITIANRTLEKAESLANEFKVRFGSIKNIKKLIQANDIIINATSVGMKPKQNESIINGNQFSEGRIVMDIVYKPIETLLIKQARMAKCRVIAGDRMLICQAAGQFKLWTGQVPDFKLMESALKKYA